MVRRADDVDLGRDRDLVARYQGGDDAAFDDLYRRYFRRLHRFCQRHTRDVHEAEEIAQEAFARALRSMDSLTGERRFYPWMTVIARRLTIDQHRKLSRLELTECPDEAAVEADLDHLFDAVDADHARAALAAVGPRHREVLLLREAEGRSYASIAEHLDVPVTTVEALLHRARKALRREYARVSGEGRALWGLPVLGLVAHRLGEVRARLADRWVEVATVGAPVLAGAVTAGLVLAPTTPDEQVTAGADDPPAATAHVAEEPAAADDPVVVTPAAPPATAPAAPPPPSPGVDTAPAASAGPVDVFVGPDGTARARDEAARMPVGTDVGPAAAGVDLAPSHDSLDEILDHLSLDPLLGGLP